MDDIKAHRDAARSAIAQAQVKQAESYNRGRKLLSFEPNEWVLVNPHSLEWLESKDKGVKLVQRWIGPFQVLERINENTYRLRMGSQYTDVPIFNIEHLRPYLDSDPEFGFRATLPDTRLHMVEAEEAKVDQIVGHRFDTRVKAWRYRVRFKKMTSDEDEWLGA
jgi:hypothetical protein